MKHPLAALVVCAVLGGATLPAAAAQPASSKPADNEQIDRPRTQPDLEDFGEFSEESKPAKKTRDPLKYYNRFMFGFNDKFYFWVAKPLAKAYNFVLPGFFREMIANAFHNVGFPVRFASSALQGKFKKAGTELGRFTINSTFGVGGLFDPARETFGLHPADEDFGQMLGRWGIGDGFPIVLPFLGPSNLRDTIGLAPNSLVNPVYYVTSWEQYLGITAGGYFNHLSLHLGEYEKIKKDALDPYTFIRDATKQNRDKRIKE